MPVSIQTTANTLTNASLFTQVSFGSITPNFGKIDVYADVTLLGASKVIWRLYATTVGISSLIALVGPITSTSPLRLIAGLKAASATTYNLTAELVEPLEQPASFAVIAGMVGYDPLINSPPVTSSSAQQLVYNTAVTFSNIGAYYPNFQVELDLTAAGPKSTSDWILYATVSGLGGNITAPVASQRYNYGPENPANLIIFQAENIGASSYTLVGVGQDSSLTPATPSVTAALTGFSPTIDGTGGGPPVTVYYQTVERNSVTSYPQQPTLNFIGAAVADDPGNTRTNVTIPALPTIYYQTVEDNGAAFMQRPITNFIGATVTDNAGNNSTDITISGGGITQLTQDVLAGPGAGSQVASVAEATGEISGPGGAASWWLPNKAGSIGLCNSPDSSPVAIYRLPGTLGVTPPSAAYNVIAADAGNVSVGGSVAGNGDTLITAIKSQFSVEIRGTAGRLVLKTSASVTNGNQSLTGIYQPFRFSNAEVYLGGAGPFTCDSGLYTTTLIECNFAGGLPGTVNLPGVFPEPGRVLHIADQSATISIFATLTLQPQPTMSVGGGALGAPLVINTTGWAQKLVLDSAGVNWMIF